MADKIYSVYCSGFINEMALVLYVYLPGSWNGEESCLTVSPSWAMAECRFKIDLNEKLTWLPLSSITLIPSQHELFSEDGCYYHGSEENSIGVITRCRKNSPKAWTIRNHY